MQFMTESSKEQSNDDDYFEVTNPLARNFVADGKSGVFLSQFIGKETTLAAASAYHKISKQRMSYWISKMLDLRLIKVARTERGSNGAQQAIYTSTASRFRITKEKLTANEWREVLARLTCHVWDRVLDSALYASRESRGNALRVFRDKSTNTTWRLIGKYEQAGSRDGYFLNWGRMALGESDYRNLQSELAEILQRYHAKTDPSSGKKIWYVLGANEEPPAE
jgi:hypothetical protein